MNSHVLRRRTGAVLAGLRRAVVQRTPWHLLASTALLAAAGSLEVQAVDGTARREAVNTPYVERAEKRLLLLEVVAHDRAGRPLCGLQISDFEVTVDGQHWPLETVDDECACVNGVTPTPTRVSAGVTDGTKLAVQPRPVDGGPLAETVVTSDEPGGRARFVLYLDFSQFKQRGFNVGTSAAGQWLEKYLPEAAEAMVVAYSWRRGLVVLAPFTHDRERLLSAVRGLDGDRNWIDDFGVTRDRRLANCWDRRPPSFDCSLLAFEEKSHQEAALSAVRALLAELASTPGRKVLLYFQQTRTMFPARLYKVGCQEFRIGDLISAVEEVGASATAARTTIHAAYVGSMSDFDTGHAVNVSANLADSTGGDYNRSPADLDRLLARVSAPKCRYLLGLTPPARPDDRVHSVRVSARGRSLPHLYRVGFYTPETRWRRLALAASAHHGRWGDLDVRAAIVPVAADPDGWRVDMYARLSVPADVEPGGAAAPSRRLGASLVIEDAGHELPRRFEAVPSGDLYRRLVSGRPLVLSAPGLLVSGAALASVSAGDLDQDLSGGDVVQVEAPDPSAESIWGPILLRETAVRDLVTLKQVDGPRDRAGRSGKDEANSATILAPLLDDALTPGEIATARTFLCHAGANPEALQLDREVHFGDRSLLLNDLPSVRRVGDCFVVEDRIGAPDEANAGSHLRYTIRWRDPKTGAPAGRSATVRVATGPPLDSIRTASRR